MAINSLRNVNKLEIDIITVPRFLDSHALQGADPEDLKKSQNEPKDEFGVSILNIMYSEDEDRMYCFMDAPDKESIKKHHDKFGYKCDYILEVDSTIDDTD